MVGGKTFWVLCLFWLSAIPSVTDAQVPGEGVTDSTIRIGILGSLTGPASDDGRDLLDGLQSYFGHINDTGGIHGRGITTRVHDDRSDPDHGLREAQRMVAEEGIFAIACTSGIGTMQALLDRGMFGDQIPVLAGAALSRSLFGHYRRNVFFFGMPYEAQVALAIESLMARSPGLVPRMGVLAPDDPLGEEAREVFHRVCGHYGLQIVGEGRYSVGADDCGSLVSRLHSAGADHALLGGTAQEAVEIMREAGRVGWSPQFIGLSSTVEPRILMEATERADGYLAVDYVARPWENVPGVAIMVGNTQRYYPAKDAQALHRCHMLGYLCGLLIEKALQDAGRELTREAFIRAFESIQNFNTHGLSGVIQYGRDSRVSDCQGRVLCFDASLGVFHAATDWSRPMIKVSR